MCLGTAPAATSWGDPAARMTAWLAENGATGMRNVRLASLDVGGVTANNVALSDSSQHVP